jgi:hypothetical protein
MSCQKEIEVYVGIDPNEALHEGYKKIIEMFAEDEEQKKKFRMFVSGFEDFVFPPDIVGDSN